MIINSQLYGVRVLWGREYTHRPFVGPGGQEAGWLYLRRTLCTSCRRRGGRSIAARTSSQQVACHLTGLRDTLIPLTTSSATPLFRHGDFNNPSRRQMCPYRTAVTFVSGLLTAVLDSGFFAIADSYAEDGEEMRADETRACVLKAHIIGGAWRGGTDSYGINI